MKIEFGAHLKVTNSCEIAREPELIFKTFNDGIIAGRSLKYREKETMDVQREIVTPEAKS